VHFGPSQKSEFSSKARKFAPITEGRRKVKSKSEKVKMKTGRILDVRVKGEVKWDLT
jgi:hypothetical protein